MGTEILQAACQAVCVMVKRCGKSLGLFTQVRRQVRLAQLPLSEPGKKKKLCQLPLVSWQVFGTHAQEALNDCLLLSEASAKHMMQQITLRHSAAVHYSHRVGFQRPQQWMENKHGWFLSINLKDACFHFPIVVEHRQFRSCHIKVTHQIKLPPFGLALTPRVSTKYKSCL